MSGTAAPGRSTTGSQDRKSKPKEGKEEMSCAMVEVWGIRGWSLKVREEPLSTGSSQNESCYLILLSTLLRFIRQLLDALQYAANRARIVCRRRSLSLSIFLLLSSVLVSVRIPCLAFSWFRSLRNARYTLGNMYTDLYTLITFNILPNTFSLSIIQIFNFFKKTFSTTIFLCHNLYKKNYDLLLAYLS